MPGLKKKSGIFRTNRFRETGRQDSRGGPGMDNWFEYFVENG